MIDLLVHIMLGYQLGPFKIVSSSNSQKLVSNETIIIYFKNVFSLTKVKAIDNTKNWSNVDFPNFFSSWKKKEDKHK